MFRTTFHNTITSLLPSDVAHSSVIDFLKTPSAVIDLSPIVTRYALRGEEKRDGTEAQVYDVWEVVDLLPKFVSGDRVHWNHEIKFVAAFHQDGDAGCTTWIDAPLGLVSKSVYRVRPQILEYRTFDGYADEQSPSSDNEIGDRYSSSIRTSWVLEEHVESSVNFALRNIVENQLVPTRKEMHQRLFNELREAGRKQGMTQTMWPGTISSEERIGKPFSSFDATNVRNIHDCTMFPPVMHR